MSIQTIALTNNQKKHLLKLITDEQVLFQDEKGDIVVSVAGYLGLKKDLKAKKEDASPIEKIVGESVLDFEAEYFVLS